MAAESCMDVQTQRLLKVLPDFASVIISKVNFSEKSC